MAECYQQRNAFEEEHRKAGNDNAIRMQHWETVFVEC